MTRKALFPCFFGLSQTPCVVEGERKRRGQLFLTMADAGNENKTIPEAETAGNGKAIDIGITKGLS
jgi:hypothetical protein